jgi:hypothetical protein
MRRWSWLPGLWAAAFALRVGFVARGWREGLTGDPLYYHWQANLVGDGRGFLQPAEYHLSHLIRPGADHPPLHTIWLALWSAVGLDTVRWHLVAGSVMGATTVVLVALAARHLGGRRAAAAAGVLAAAWPNLVFWDIGGYAESTAAAAVALFVLLGVRYLERPGPGRLALVGMAGALAGLARSELVVLVLAVVPLALAVRPLDRRLVLRWVAGGLGAAAALVLPWSAYNQLRFEEPVPLSTGLGLVLASSNCDTAYQAPGIGYWSFACSWSGNIAGRTAQAPDQSVVDQKLRKAALHYIARRPERLPAVVTARVGRMAGVYAPDQSVDLAVANEGIERPFASAIVTTWWLGAALAIGGGIALRRRGHRLVPVLAPVLATALTAVITYGIVRFRAPAEPAVLVLAGVGVARLVEMATATPAGVTVPRGVAAPRRLSRRRAVQVGVAAAVLVALASTLLVVTTRRDRADLRATVRDRVGQSTPAPLGAEIDHFDEAGTLGAFPGVGQWEVATPGWVVSDGIARAVPSAAAPAVAVVEVDARSTFQVDVAQLRPGSGFVVRYEGPTDHWRVVVGPDGTDWVIERVTAAGVEPLGTFRPTPVITYGLGIWLEADALVVAEGATPLLRRPLPLDEGPTRVGITATSAETLFGAAALLEG